MINRSHFKASMRRVTTQQVQKFEQERRRKDFWAEDVNKYAATDKMLAGNYRSDQRVDAKRKTREMIERENQERLETERLEVL